MEESLYGTEVRNPLTTKGHKGRKVKVEVKVKNNMNKIKNGIQKFY